MIMRYINRFNAPSISVMVRADDSSLSRIVLKKGEGSVTAEEHDLLLTCEAIRDFVKDGYLSFPNCPDFRAIEGINEAARRARERELWGEQEERKQASPEDLGALTELVGTQAAELTETKAQYAKLLERFEEMDKKLAAAESAKATPKPVPVVAALKAPAAPIAAAAPAAPVVPPPPASQ